MTRARLCLLACGLLLASNALAQLPPMISPAEITAGMKGYGFSVFHGEEIERFDVECVGVLPFGSLDDDLIMIRVTSGPVAERRSGVVGGMSGSPIYFNDRLAGAIGFGWNMTRESVGLVQPIGQMLRAFDRAEAPDSIVDGRPGLRPGETRHLAQAVNVLGRHVDRVTLAPAGSTRVEAPGELVARPVATPVSLSGLGGFGADRLATALAPYGFELQAVPGGRAEGDIQWQPGAAIGVLLVDGDIRSAATGTLTLRDGNRVLAFGHSMMDRGRVLFPICGARIIDFINSYQRSDKLSVALDPAGALLADTRWGIAGELGAAPEMVPVKLTITDPEGLWGREWNYRVIRDRELTNIMSTNILSSLIGGQLGELSKATYTARSVVKFVGRQPVERVRTGFIASGSAVGATSEVLNAVRLAMAPTFDELALESIELGVNITHEDPTARMVRARFDRQRVKPGEDVKLQIELRRRDDGETRLVDLTIPVPPTVAPGTYRLGVAPGSLTAVMDEQLGTQELPVVTTDQTLARLDERPDDDLHLVAKLVVGGQDLALRGLRLPTPPSHVQQLLARAGITDVSQTRAAIVVREPVDMLVTNLLYTEVLVLDPLTGDPPKPPATQQGAGQQGGGQSGDANRAFTFVSQAADPALDGPLAHFGRIPQWLKAYWGQPAEHDLDLAPAQAGIAGPPQVSPGTTRQPLPSTTKQPGGGADAAGQAEGTGSAEKQPVEQTTDTTPAAARAPKTWQLTTTAEFAPGEAEGVQLSPTGTLSLGIGAERVGEWDEPLVWAADTDAAGTTWLATGTQGQLVRLTNGEASVAWSGENPLVTAVAAGAGGPYFATAPGGAIQRLTANGAATAAETGSTYVWALATSRDGQSTLAVTGLPSRVLRLAGDELTELGRSEAAHLLAVAEAPDGTVWAGGGQPGRLLRCVDGRAEVAATTPDDVTAIAIADDGTVYFAYGSAVAQLTADGGRRALANFSGSRVLALHPTADGVLVTTGLRADGRSVVWQVVPARREATAVFDTKVAGLTALAPQADGTLLAASAVPAALYQLSLPIGPRGTYLSPVLDAGGRARWGAFELGLADDSAGSVVVDARSGDSAAPDAEWSPWTAVGGEPSCPSARYLQYRLTFVRGDDGNSPLVESTRLSYILANNAPTVSLETPTVAQAFRTKFDLKWKVSDPESDQVLTSISLKREGETEWRVLEPEIALGTDTYSLDPVAHKVEDGAYRLRLIVDDIAFNPTQPLQGQVISEPFWIDTTAPRAALPETLTEGDGLAFTLPVTDNHRVASVEWRLNDGPWRAAAAADGLFDSRLEQAAVNYRPIPAGEQTLHLRIKDVAGNETVLSQQVAGTP